MSNVRVIRWAAIGEPDFNTTNNTPAQYAPVEPAVEPAKEPVPA